MLTEAKSKEELDKTDELKRPQDVKELTNSEKKVKKQMSVKLEELESYQQQPDESELQKKLVSLVSMVSLELNIEWTTKTLKNAKATSFFMFEGEQDIDIKTDLAEQDEPEKQS